MKSNSRFIAVQSLFWCLAASVAPAQPVSNGLQESLDQMALLEARIQQLLEDEAATEREMRDLGDDILDARRRVLATQRMESEGRTVLEIRERQVKRVLDSIGGEMDLEREKLERAKAGVRLSVPLVLHESNRRGPVDPRTITMALIHQRHREQANISLQNLSSLESREDSLRSDRTGLQSLAGRRASFSTMSLRELRDSHRALSDRMAGLHAKSDETRTDVAALNERRTKLDDLISKLSSGARVEANAARGSDAEPSRRRGPILPTDDEYRPSATEVASVAIAEEAPASGDTIETRTESDGHRRLFWWASPTRIRALAPGKVLFSGAFAGYRHLLVVEHEEGWATIYGNLTSTELSEGETIAENQVIGEYQARDSERAEPLWVEVRLRTKPVPIENLPGVNLRWAERFHDQSPSSFRR